MAIDGLKQIWPEWKIEAKPLGKGSFGVVYKAVRRDHHVESYAAIKVISIPSDSSEVDSLRSEGLGIDATKTYLQGIVNDFISEIQLMESLKGVQNIVSVEDYKVVEKTDEIGWDIYIRMELLTPFNTYICDKRLTEEEVIKLGCDICTALEICSQRNIIHRDIKPENIFINDFGHFKLGDFGIARKMENLTGGLSQKGTYNYMAPEVANGSDYDARADIYSLGIVLYRLLNGNRLPFLDTEKQLLNPNERRNAIERRLRGEKLGLPCDASPAMANLILQACAYDPQKRFASATEMKQALMSVENGTYQSTIVTNPNKTTSVRKAPPAKHLTQKAVNTFGEKKKSKIPVIVATMLVGALLIFGGLFIVPRFINNFADEREISSIIDEAEEFATDGDYESALAKIKIGLDTYPKSEILLEKETEYADALTAQIKERMLEEAESMAASGDYVSAIALIKDAQDTYGDDADCKQAYDSYSSAYESQIISASDQLANNGDYDGAIQKVNEGIAVLGKREELTQKIKEYQLGSYITDAATHAESNDYAEALAILDTAEQVLGKQERLDEEREKIQKAQLFNAISRYEEASDYPAAIRAIEQSNTAVQKDPDVIQKLNSLKMIYRDKVIIDADSALKESGYSEAIKIINDGLSVLSSDEKLLAKIKEYEAYVPVNLFSMEFFEASATYDVVRGPNIATDNIGEEHSESYTLVDSSHSNAWATYRINGDYSKLTGCFFLLFEERSTKTDQVLSIYGDDKLLFTVTITGGTEPVDFSVDISGVKYLKISYHTHASSNGFPSRLARLSDVYLSK